MLSTANRGASPPGTNRLSLNRIPALSLTEVCQIATVCPCILPAAAEYARRFFPRSSLGRLA